MDNTTQNSVLQKVDEQSIVNLASELIKIPSFAPGETPVAEFLGSYFKERGYQVDMQEVEPGRFQTIATLKGNGNGQPSRPANWICRLRNQSLFQNDLGPGSA